jgi:hypothetical protein
MPLSKQYQLGPQPFTRGSHRLSLIAPILYFISVLSCKAHAAACPVAAGKLVLLELVVHAVTHVVLCAASAAVGSSLLVRFCCSTDCQLPMPLRWYTGCECFM